MKVCFVLIVAVLLSYFTIFYLVVNTHFNEHSLIKERITPVIEHPTQNIDIEIVSPPLLRKKKTDILWVVPAFKRAWTLDLLLDSLQDYTVLVSKDSRNTEINEVILKHTVESMEHPWSCSIHPNTFPAKDESLNVGYKGDTYGNPRSSWATCLKHHWWWMMNKAWSRNPRQVCVVEDDTIPHPAAFKWLSQHKGNVKLTPNPIAVPWCMDKDTWKRVDPQFFCNHDDYNWDQTIAWMFAHKFGPNTATVPSISLSMHIGDCDGWDAGGRKVSCTKDKIVEIKNRLKTWQRQKITVVSEQRTWLRAHTRPNGGWGHPKDHKHCLLNTLPPIKRVIQTTSKQIVKTLGAIHLNGGKTKFPCDVPCYIKNGGGSIIQKYSIDELATSITISMEGEQHHPQLLLQEGMFMGTTRLTSTIPTSYYNWAWTRYLDKEPTTKDKWSQNWIQAPHKPLSHVKKAAVFIARNCNSLSKREDLVTKLMKYIQVDSPSTCLHNMEMSDRSDKIKMMEKYAFYLAFENEITTDYITEKLWNTFKAGVIPVYFGAPNVREHLPHPRSIINVADYKSIEALSQHLNDVLNDEKLYDSYHAWRYKPLPKYFVTKYNFTHVHSVCRICRWAYAKKYHYGWDKEQQEVIYKSSAPKYVVVIPSVKRHNDEYLHKTLESLQRAKPLNVDVLLINANEPPKEHTALETWCKTHKEYHCKYPPPVSSSLLEEVYKTDKRHDTQKYLKWRTHETTHALFGMEEFIKTGAKYMIWLQDDVTVENNLFSLLKDVDVLCLRSDGYCGLVAYMFSQNFIKGLIPSIKKNKNELPIDWIVDGYFRKAFPSQKLQRLPVAYHHGVVSSSGRTRAVTTNEKQLLERKCRMLPIPSNVKVKKRKNPRNIIQIFPFSHEVDMLRMKINNTRHYTDEFIIIEGDKTFSLQPKKYYLDKYMKEMTTLANIKRMKLKIKATNKYSWDVQNEMRLSDHSISYYFPHVEKNSIVVSTDLDEIIKPNVLCLLKHYDFDPMPTGVIWRPFIYGFYNEKKRIINAWGSFGTVSDTPVSIRGRKKHTWLFQDGGWHCSWCMTVNDIILKLKHSPYVDLPRIADTPKFMKKEVICNLIKAGRWFFDTVKKEKRMTLSKDIPQFAPSYMLSPTC